MYQPRYNQIFTLGWLKELIENGGDVPNQIWFRMIDERWHKALNDHGEVEGWVINDDKVEKRFDYHSTFI